MKKQILSLIFLVSISLASHPITMGMVGTPITKTQAVEYFNYYKNNTPAPAAPNSIVLQKSMVQKFLEIFNWYGQQSSVLIFNGIKPIEVMEGNVLKEYLVIGLIYSSKDILSEGTFSANDFLLWEPYDTIPAGGVRGIKPPAGVCPPVCD